MKEVLSEHAVSYEYMDITSNITILKAFLKIRDTSEAHRMARETHRVGVPCIVADDQVYITESTESVEALISAGKLS